MIKNDSYTYLPYLLLTVLVSPELEQNITVSVALSVFAVRTPIALSMFVV